MILVGCWWKEAFLSFLVETPQLKLLFTMVRTGVILISLMEKTQHREKMLEYAPGFYVYALCGIFLEIRVPCTYKNQRLNVLNQLI